MMKETHEEDDPQSDNLFCLENTVSNVMPAVWWSKLDFVAINKSSCLSSCGTAYCQKSTSYVWRVSREFLVCRVVLCQVASCDCLTLDFTRREWLALNPNPTQLSMESF